MSGLYWLQGNGTTMRGTDANGYWLETDGDKVHASGLDKPSGDPHA